MRHLLFVLLGFSIANAVSAQSWTQIDIGQTETLNKVYFKNDTTGFILGDNGLLLITKDSGNTWDTTTTHTLHDLRTVSFANDDVGYINGLKTTDGGASWTPQPSSEIYGFMYAYDESRIMAGHGSLFDGTIYESIDGGLSWLPHWGFGGLTMFNDCAFLNQDEGYLSSWYAGHLFKTTDAGANWTEVVIDEVDGNGWISDDYLSVAFPSRDTLLVTHEDGLLITFDAGSTWSEIKPEGAISNFYPTSVIVLGPDSYLLANRGNNPMLASPRIYETSDGGTNWIASANTTESIFDVACNSTYCFAVGSNGTVYRKEKITTGTSTPEIAESFNIAVVPNPVQKALKIICPKEITEVRIYNAVGQYHYCILSHYDGVEVSHLKPGLYFIEVISSNGEIATSKFIKE